MGQVLWLVLGCETDGYILCGCETDSYCVAVKYIRLSLVRGCETDGYCVAVRLIIIVWLSD